MDCPVPKETLLTEHEIITKTPYDVLLLNLRSPVKKLNMQMGERKVRLL